MGFFYSVTATIINSIWQSGLLILFYLIATSAFGQIHPLQKRNLLYGLLAAQVLVSALTFLFYINSSSAGMIRGLQVLSSKGLFAWLHTYDNFIFYVYAAAVLSKSVNIFMRRKGFKATFIRGRVRPAAELKIFTELKAYQLGIKRKVTLWYSHTIHTPLTFGFFKPVILLPFSLVAGISMRETEAIILHELAHIKNRDYLLNLFLLAADTVYCFNPFIKIIIGKIKLEREKNCDIQVLNFEYPTLLYAEALLKTARSSKAGKSFHPGAVNKMPELLQRIQFFSEEHNLVFHRRLHSLPAVICILFLITTAIFFLPGFQAQPVSSSGITLPFASYERSTPVLYDGIAIAQNGTPVFDKISPTNNMINSEMTGNAPISLNIDKPASTFAERDENLFAAIPADYNETPDSTKELIYRVETQEGNVIQAFKMILLNGQWIMEPQWMMMETKPDSTRKNILCPPVEPVQ